MQLQEIEELVDRRIAEALAQRLPPKKDNYYTAKVAGEQLGLSSDTILRKVKSGELTAIGERKMLRISESSIIAYIAANKK